MNQETFSKLFSRLVQAEFLPAALIPAFTRSVEQAFDEGNYSESQKCGLRARLLQACAEGVMEGSVSLPTVIMYRHAQSLDSREALDAYVWQASVHETGTGYVVERVLRLLPPEATGRTRERVRAMIRAALASLPGELQERVYHHLGAQLLQEEATRAPAMAGRVTDARHLLALFSEEFSAEIAQQDLDQVRTQLRASAPSAYAPNPTRQSQPEPPHTWFDD